jgi:DNA-directed RNA polymerase
MLKDDIGGRAVNVVPQERPQDIYLRIADHVLDALQERAAGDELARLWLSSGLVNRKLTKRPTMTFGYGSKVYGFQEQLQAYVQGLENHAEMREHFSRPIGDDAQEMLLLDACGLMATLIWNALQEIVVAASEGMAWLQKAARAVVKTNMPVQWVVPGTGFPVRQEYYVMKTRRIETLLAGQVIRPRIYEATEKVETYKQANAVAPNVVHSLDAAALMLTVSRAADNGIEAFAAIHDSYGTVPADMPVLLQATRQSFAQLYSDHDVVGELFAQFSAQTPQGKECPTPPVSGTLEVSAVLASDYFFC